MEQATQEEGAEDGGNGPQEPPVCSEGTHCRARNRMEAGCEAGAAAVRTSKQQSTTHGFLLPSGILEQAPKDTR